MPKITPTTSIQPKFQRFAHIKQALPMLVIFTLALILSSCGSQPTPEEQIRQFIFTNQPSTPEQFVRWANTNLTDYSTRQIYKAIYSEGERQAELGHANAVGVLSHAALAWAEAKHLQYNPAEWTEIQQTAISNLRQGPAGELQLWPNK
ncbi:MAG TPA: hypothetical protein P5526_00100 [Anaerolineae bacterium]|nr:hypothetical protein [Anaerolineae bacterium]